MDLPGVTVGKEDEVEAEIEAKRRKIDTTEVRETSLEIEDSSTVDENNTEIEETCTETQQSDQDCVWISIDDWLTLDSVGITPEVTDLNIHLEEEEEEEDDFLLKVKL